MINKKVILAFVLLSVIVVFPSFGNSVWNENTASPYSSQKAYKIGDIINVMIVETSSAKNQAETKTNLKDDLGIQFTHTLQRLAPIIGTNTQVTGQAANTYTGNGQTTRGSTMQARVSAWVTDVLPNGNLAIKGQHKLEINDELQEINITGIVRPKDISGANTIFSYQVASAELSVKGTGSVGDAESPGWITRFINWIF